MSYNMHNFVNDTTPPISAENLNDMDKGIYDNDARIGNVYPSFDSPLTVVTRSDNYHFNSGTAPTSISYADNGVTFTHGSSNFVVYYDVPTKANEKYVFSFNITTGSVHDVKIQDKGGTVLDTISSASGEISSEVTAISDKIHVYFSIYYNVPTCVIKNAFYKVKDAFFSIKKNALPDLSDSDLTDSFTNVCPQIFASNQFGAFEVFTNGMYESSLPDGEYSIRCTWVNVFSMSGVPKKAKINVSQTTKGTLQPPIEIYDKKGYIGNPKQTIRVAGQVSNPGSVKNILFIGDSLIGSGTFTNEFRKYIQNDLGLTNYNLIGRLSSLSQYNKYEGVGGYSWNNYTQNPNTLPSGYPNNYFWNPNSDELDISYYVDTYCSGDAPDYIIANLGWNHIVNPVYSSDLDEIETLVKTFIEQVHTEYPNCKIILNGMHYGMPNSYYPTDTYRQFAIKLGALYNAISKNASYSSYVLFCDIAPYFDAENGMRMSTRAKSIWTSDTETYITDYVHPSDNGYKMHAFADVCAFLYLVS